MAPSTWGPAPTATSCAGSSPRVSTSLPPPRWSSANSSPESPSPSCRQRGGASGGGPVPAPAEGDSGGSPPTRAVEAAHARVARALAPGRGTDIAPLSPPVPKRAPSPPDGRVEPKPKRARRSEQQRVKRLANMAKAVEARARRTAPTPAKGTVQAPPTPLSLRFPDEARPIRRGAPGPSLLERPPQPHCPPLAREEAPSIRRCPRDGEQLAGPRSTNTPTGRRRRIRRRQPGGATDLGLWSPASHPGPSFAADPMASS